MSDQPPRVPWYREPLLHFLILGGLLFGVSLTMPGDEETDERRIVFDDDQRQELIDRHVRERGVEPTPAQLEELIQQWVYAEILYREGVALGLDKGDPVIRGRVIRKMAEVQGDLAAVGEADPDELRAYFDANRARYDEPVRVDMQHVFVAGTGDEKKAEAEKLEILVEGGAKPRGLGERFKGGRKLRRRSLQSIEKVFGKDFASGIDELSRDEWHVRQSDHGWHVVHIDRVYPAKPANFEEIQVELAEAWKAEARQSATKEELEALQDRYEIVGVEGWE